MAFYMVGQKRSENGNGTRNTNGKWEAAFKTHAGMWAVIWVMCWMHKRKEPLWYCACLRQHIFSARFDIRRTNSLLNLVRLTIQIFSIHSCCMTIIYKLGAATHSKFTGVIAFPSLKKLKIFSMPIFSNPICDSTLAPAVWHRTSTFVIFANLGLTCGSS
jgi:hypothetical protein